LNKRIQGLLHHNLFFDTDFGIHAEEIYTNPKWPENPLFYVSAPGKTDSSCAPEGCENLFILIPVAPGLQENPEIQEHYFDMVIKRLEERTGEAIRQQIILRRDYAYSNFVSDYHSFKGNAYGLANTLNQTAILKPKMQSNKVKNLTYTGQLTVPGPGVPPSLISGKIAARLIHKKNQSHA
jgi:phytoene desaturase